MLDPPASGAKLLADGFTVTFATAARVAVGSAPEARTDGGDFVGVAGRTRP